MISFDELLVILVIALIILGPQLLIKTLTNITAFIVSIKNNINKIKSNNKELQSILDEVSHLRDKLHHPNVLAHVEDSSISTHHLYNKQYLDDDFALKQPELFEQ